MKDRIISTASSTVPESQAEIATPARQRKGFVRLLWKAIREPEKIPQAIGTELFALKVLVTSGVPDVLLQLIGGIGDELLLTAVAHELKQRTPNLKIWQVAYHSQDMLEKNPDYENIFGSQYLSLCYSNFLNRQRLRLRYAECGVPGEVEIPSQRHIIAELCFRAGVRGEVSIRPYLYLTSAEETRGRFAEHQIVVHCVREKSHYMANKVWPETKYERLITLMRNVPAISRRYKIIQVGTDRDPALPGVLDLRGRTTLRETAAILKNSEVFVGGSGLLTHMARAVDCRSVIIYGGREHSYQSGYICNENIDSFVNCAPCWRWDTCDFERKCMTMIEPNHVLEAIERGLAKRGQPLDVETVTL